MCLKTLLTFFFFFLLSSPLFSAETYFSSYLKLKGGYDNNVGFSYYHPEEDFFTVVSPYFYLNYKSEKTACYSKFGLNIYKYAQLDHLDTVNQDYEVKADYLWKERWKLFGNAYFIKDTTLQSELQETGIVHVREDRKRYNLSLGTTYLLTELTQLTFNIAGSRTEYEWKYYADYSSLSLETTLQHQLKTQRDTFVSKLKYMYINSKNSKLDNIAFLIGLQHLFSKTVRFTAFLGVRYTITSFYIYYQRIIINPNISPPFEIITEKREETDKEWNYLADISLKKNGEKTVYYLNINRNLTYGSFGEAINKTRFLGSVSYKWDPRWTFLFSASYYITSSKGEVYKENNRLFTLKTVLKYLLKKYWTLNLCYLYSKFKDRFRDHNFDRNQFLIILKIQFGKSKAVK